IGVPGERDRYTFSLASAGRFYFDTLTNSNTISWTLTGPAGTLVNARLLGSSDSFDFSGNPAMPLGAGDYTLTVDGAGDVTGPYQFRFVDLASAVALTPATPVSGDFTPAI